MLLSLIIMSYKGETGRNGNRKEDGAQQTRKTHEQRIHDAVALRAGSSSAGVLVVSNRHESFHLILRADDQSPTVSFSGLTGQGWISGIIRFLNPGITLGGYQETSRAGSNLFQATGGRVRQPSMINLDQRVMEPDLLNRLALIAEHGHVDIVLTARARSAANALH